MVNIPKIPDKKTTWFLFLGIVLYLGSTQSMLKTTTDILGQLIGIIIIIIALLAQGKNWTHYWHVKKHNLNLAIENKDYLLDEEVKKSKKNK